MCVAHIRTNQDTEGGKDSGKKHTDRPELTRVHASFVLTDLSLSYTAHFRASFPRAAFVFLA